MNVAKIDVNRNDSFVVKELRVKKMQKTVMTLKVRNCHDC